MAMLPNLDCDDIFAGNPTKAKARTQPTGVPDMTDEQPVAEPHNYY